MEALIFSRSMDIPHSWSSRSSRFLGEYTGRREEEEGDGEERGRAMGRRELGVGGGEGSS